MMTEERVSMLFKLPEMVWEEKDRFPAMAL